MQYCSKCRVNIRGENERCVLCGNTLTKLPSPEGREEVFPEIPRTVESHLAIRILIFISVAAVIASFAIRLVFPTDVNWPVFVVFGLASMWLGLIVVVKKRNNIPKTILWQVAIVTVLSIFWDWQTGWKGWSLDYLIPILYVAAELVMYVSAKIMKLSIRDYITYAMLDALFGVLPILFIVFDWVKTPYPSVISVSASVIFLAAIFIFQGDKIRTELHKRMHI